MSILDKISEQEKALQGQFSDRLVVNPELNRTLVSFQANKKQEAFRWFSYREGFSAPLIEYLYDQAEVREGTILDPFAGSGTAPFVASSRGMDSVGIELLPVGVELIEVRKILSGEGGEEFLGQIRQYLDKKPWLSCKTIWRYPHLRITLSAFSEENEKVLGRYIAWASSLESKRLSRVLKFAAMAILEPISYTRKDGQYLRWDNRSGRKAGKSNFSKGKILDFDQAIVEKLEEIFTDLTGRGQTISLFPEKRLYTGDIRILKGSCLEILPTLPSNSFDGIITSPPYCNRYDYTRTYALELAFMGVDEQAMRHLRQTMLSCTVENLPKDNLLHLFGEVTDQRATKAFKEQALLQSIITFLEKQKVEGILNNNGIPRMVRNYFFENAYVISECARVLKPGAPFIMVNDNVRYEGVHVPVDLILSDLAQRTGFSVESIWALPVGKGNSSQQMGKHGRQELRKGVYVWRAPTEKQASRRGRQVDSDNLSLPRAEGALPQGF